MTYNISDPQNWHSLNGTWRCLGIERMLKMLPTAKNERKYILLELETSRVHIMTKVLFHFNIDPIVMKKNIVSI